MPINAMRRIEPLITDLVREIHPAQFITEVAKIDKPGYFRNFKGYRVERFNRGKIEKIARKEIFERENSMWAQLFIVLWNNANRNLYHGFRTRVQTINEDVEKVETIEDELANTWLDEMLEEYKLEDLLICVHLNEVRFTDEFVRSRMEAPLNIERDAALVFPSPIEDSEE